MADIPILEFRTPLTDVRIEHHWQLSSRVTIFQLYKDDDDDNNVILVRILIKQDYVWRK